MPSRRDFLGVLGAVPFVLQAGRVSANNDEIENDKLNCSDNVSLIVPEALKTGDTVAFTAPASPITASKLSVYIKYYKEKGCKILIGDTIKNKDSNGWFSATDNARAAELNTMFANDDIKAIVCGRGGYGVMRILPDLDYDSFRRKPKILIGYSDITALHLALQRRSMVVTYHGPVGSSTLTEQHRKNVDTIVFASPDKIKYNLPEMRVCNDVQWKFSGKLSGGNLTLISATMGSDYEIDLTDGVLFVEDTSILPHDLDRMLTQLMVAGKFKSCNGIIVGKMKAMDRRESFFPNRAFSMLDVIGMIAKKVNLPCVYNLPFGHIESQMILPYGLYATVNIKEKTLLIN